MDKLTKGLLHNRTIVVFFLLIVVLIGGISYYLVPKQENPDTTIAVALVTTIYPGASPEEVEEYVTDNLEDEIGKLEHVDYTTSMSMESASAIVVYYDTSVGIEDVESKLRECVSDAQSQYEIGGKQPVYHQFVRRNLFYRRTGILRQDNQG